MRLIITSVNIKLLHKDYFAGFLDNFNENIYIII
jgi:hypothetical protein